MKRVIDNVDVIKEIAFESIAISVLIGVVDRK